MAKKKLKKKLIDEPKAESIVDRIAPVHETPKIMSALFYGRAGTGKTVVACTFPKPLLLIDIREKGYDSVSHVPGVHLAKVNTWEEFEELYWHLESGASKFATVVIDQVSQLQDVLMDDVRNKNNVSDSDPISRRLWGEISGGMKTWINNYRDLVDKGIHVCMLAHERSTDGGDAVEDQIDPSIGPRVMPSVASHLNGAVSVIGNTFIREHFMGKGDDKVRRVDYSMRIGPHSFYTTKIRHPTGMEAPDVIVNPTFDKIMQVSRGESIKRTLKKK
jgi:hypothetical protein